MINDDHLKGYHCWYSIAEYRKRNGVIGMNGQRQFVELPIYTIKTPHGKTIRAPVTSVATYLDANPRRGTYLGKILA